MNDKIRTLRLALGWPDRVRDPRTEADPDWNQGLERSDPLGDLRSAHNTVRETLRQAADKLDHQANAHGEGIHDYTDLLRVWADSPTRWIEGS